MSADVKHDQRNFVDSLDIFMSKRKRSGFFTGSRKRRKTSEKKSAINVANQALSIVRAIERKAEDKFTNTSATAALITDAGSVTELFELVQGINFGERIGMDVTAKWMVIRFKLEVHGSATSTAFRMIIIRDNEGTNPTIATILNNVSVLAPMNHLNRHRFKVLYDRLMVVSMTSGQRAITQVMHIKLKFPQRYSGTGSDTVEKNGVFLMLLGDEVTNDPTYAFHAAMHYSDT